MLYRFCDDDLPFSGRNTTLHTGILYVSFTTDETDNYPGFLLHWQTVPLNSSDGGAVAIDQCTSDTICGGELAENDTLIAPVRPTYGISCLWTIPSPPGKVTINFYAVSLHFLSMLQTHKFMHTTNRNI